METTQYKAQVLDRYGKVQSSEFFNSEGDALKYLSKNERPTTRNFLIHTCEWVNGHGWDAVETKDYCNCCWSVMGECDPNTCNEERSVRESDREEKLRHDHSIGYFGNQTI